MTNVWERVAAQFRDERPRWATPLDLAVALDPSYRRTPALELISDALVDVAMGRCPRLAVSMPVQEGKTSLLQVFTLWLLTFRPELRNVVASYEQDIAQRYGRRVRDLITQNTGRDRTLDLGLRVRRGDHSVARWSLDNHAGGVVSVGIGGSLTGRAVDGVLIVDDAIKGHEEAMSAASRTKVWEWFRSTALTRLAPDAGVVVVGTRWHHDDLIGRLIKDAPQDWRVINIPAIADSDDDPLGRALGEPLVSARGERDWDSTRRSVGDYLWSALYMGQPAPQGGGLFQTDKIRRWSVDIGPAGDSILDLDGRAMPLSMCWRVCIADLAASTRTSADYTVIAAVAITPDRDLVVLDLVRDRMTPDRHFEAARPLLKKWGGQTLYIEQMMSTMALTSDAARAGIPVSPLKASQDKVTRALPAAARMEQGRVWIPEGASWGQAFVDELAAFPFAGSHDDQCDVLAYAAQLDSTHYSPPLSAEQEEAMRRRVPDPEMDAIDRALGFVPGAPQIDLMTVPLY